MVRHGKAESNSQTGSASQRGFFYVCRSSLEALKGSPRSATEVYIELCSLADENGICAISASELSFRLPFGRVTVFKAINRLVGIGLIVRESGGGRTLNRYTVVGLARSTEQVERLK